MNKFITLLFIGSMVFSLVLAGVVSADSTIGTNISTTGTLKVTTGGATAVQFQNAAGTNLFIFDHTNLRLGIGATPGTTFEVQGTASASYFLTGNTIQAGGFASVAYNRFGTATTNHANYISTTNDVLISGDLEVRATASFGSTASVSGIFFMNDGRHRPNANSATAFRFQNAAGGTNVLTIDTTNARVGAGNIGGALDTVFEVGGTASATNVITTGAVQFAGTGTSVAYSRFGTSTTNHANYISASNDLLVSGDAEIRGSASFGGTASVSGIFFMNDGRFRPNANSATAFRFQNAAGATDVLTIDTSNTRVGVGNIGGTLDTLFEVGGTASVSTLFATTKIVTGSGTASASAYTAEFVSTGTTSVLFGGSSTTLGTCLQLKNTTGQPVYARVVGTTWTVSAVSCR